MRQLNLFVDDGPAAGPPLADFESLHPCPGCGAKAKTWSPGRFARVLAWWGYIPLCVECALIPEVMLAHIREYQPALPAERLPCQRGDDVYIAQMEDRRGAGAALFHPDDPGRFLPAFRRVPTGAPDHQHAVGETGVEKCGSRWRVRPFWRGRKWPLGVFACEADAIERARVFWRTHGADRDPPPVMWLPCGDDDGAIPVERERITEWQGDWPGVNVRQVAARYRKELRALRKKPPSFEVWHELIRRIAAAAGVTLFGQLLLDELVDPAEFPLGV